MTRKKWFSNGKHSDSQIFLKTQRLHLQMVVNNSIAWNSSKKQHEKLVAILINYVYMIFLKRGIKSVGLLSKAKQSEQMHRSTFL